MVIKQEISKMGVSFIGPCLATFIAVGKLESNRPTHVTRKTNISYFSCDVGIKDNDNEQGCWFFFRCIQESHAASWLYIYTLEWGLAILQDKFMMVIHQILLFHLWEIQYKFSLLQEPAIAFAQKGYHILLEKPMAVSRFKKVSLISPSLEFNKMFWLLSHVLKHSSPFSFCDAVVTDVERWWWFHFILVFQTYSRITCSQLAVYIHWNEDLPYYRINLWWSSIRFYCFICGTASKKNSIAGASYCFCWKGATTFSWRNLLCMAYLIKAPYNLEQYLTRYISEIVVIFLFKFGFHEEFDQRISSKYRFEDITWQLIILSFSFCDKTIILLCSLLDFLFWLSGYCGCVR